ncbi:MAG: hypothetical protein ACK5Z5_08160 [Neisseriaceae bacterium]
MPAWFYELNLINALVLIYVIFGGIGFIAYKLYVKYLKDKDADFLINIARQTCLTFGTIFIAFWIAINWQSINNLNLACKGEAQAILNLYSSTHMLDKLHGNQMRSAVNNYLDSVISEGYESLENGEINLRTKAIFDKLRLAVYNLPTDDFEQRIIFSKLTQSMNILAESRTKRQDYVKGQMNGILLAFFILLLLNICIWTAFTYHPKRILTSMVVISQFIIILSAVWLIFELDRPFQGYFRVDNSAFIEAKSQIKQLNY